MVNKLKEKLQTVRKQKEQALANYNALNGAEQMLLQLISEFEREETKNETSND